ncbi:MAG: phosphoribosyltransferase [Actinomycetia bacterium]|nr:phosphoribosyltransferase [Actinomycetes bacterium]
MFEDRASAGRELARSLEKFRDQDVLVIGIPRGGVILAAEVADALNAPLDLIITRKIGAPGNEELAIGAVAGGGQVMLNSKLVEALNVSKDYIEERVEKAVAEIKRRRRLYLGELPSTNVGNKTVLVIDDGLATGYTALAAIEMLRTMKPQKIVLAVPVAPSETVARLTPKVDELVYLSMPREFFAVGQFYDEFHQVTDEEVIDRIKARAT